MTESRPALLIGITSQAGSNPADLPVEKGCGVHALIMCSQFGTQRGEELCGDVSRVRGRLGWRARTKSRNLVLPMVERDLASAGIGPADYVSAP
jgi:GDP-D-mannose dehydratase